MLLGHQAPNAVAPTTALHCLSVLSPQVQPAQPPVPEDKVVREDAAQKGWPALHPWEPSWTSTHTPGPQWWGRCMSGGVPLTLCSGVFSGALTLPPPHPGLPVRLGGAAPSQALRLTLNWRRRLAISYSRCSSMPRRRHHLREFPLRSDFTWMEADTRWQVAGAGLPPRPSQRGSEHQALGGCKAGGSPVSPPQHQLTSFFQVSAPLPAS